MDRDVQNEIKQTVESNPVVLFMKGNRTFPMCGFSAAVVEVLTQTGVEFKEVNVLEDQDVRQGIKSFSDWPTIPQLYVNGQFVGGCDIVREMHAKGELEPLLKAGAS
ncbi:MAG: Grx4 family monothiol glutaredoxin [Myxococcota bacterium]